MSRPYVLTRGAANDLRNIARYTVETWGAQQCRVYIEQIEEAASEVAQGRGVFKDMSELQPGLRLRVVGRHYIFCQPQTNGPALILAVLHERMNIIARLKDRLA